MTELKGQPSSYYQMDEDTNRILSCPADCLMNNFNGLKTNLSAYIDEKTFSEGKIQSVVSDGNVITIGIDLSDSKGYRVVEGDEQNWKQEKETDKLPKYNLDFMDVGHLIRTTTYPMYQKRAIPTNGKSSKRTY